MSNSVGIAVLAAIGAANLVLTLALLGRVREQTRWLRQSIEGVTNPEPIMLPAGEVVRDFAATTVDGSAVVRADLRGHTLVGFFSPTCPACAESLPAFVARAVNTPGGRERTLAVLTRLAGSEAAVDELRERLAPVARVVIEPAHGEVARAFGVTGMPAFALLSGDTVVGSHFVLERVPDAAPA